MDILLKDAIIKKTKVGDTTHHKMIITQKNYGGNHYYMDNNIIKSINK